MRGESFGETFRINDRLNQLVIEALDARVWRAPVLGPRGRTVAAIFAHVHNIRRKWLRLTAPQMGVPAQLDRLRCTPRQTRVSLARSAAQCAAMLDDADITTFWRDGWARAWPAGPMAFAYMIAHEAHHRGQVCLLARQLGYGLPVATMSAMWSWERYRTGKSR